MDEIWSYDGEEIKSVRDMNGRQVRRGDILIEASGAKGGAKGWVQNWRFFEMPKLLNGNGYTYHMGRRSEFKWADPSKSVVVDDPVVCVWFREQAQCWEASFYSDAKTGTLSEIFEKAESKPWERLAAVEIHGS